MFDTIISMLKKLNVYHNFSILKDFWFASPKPAGFAQKWTEIFQVTSPVGDHCVILEWEPYGKKSFNCDEKEVKDGGSTEE